MASVFPAYQTPGESATHTSAATRWPQLPFQSVFALDFEFVSESGAEPVPVCMVARELISDRLIRLWQDELGAGAAVPDRRRHAVRGLLRVRRDSGVSSRWAGRCRRGSWTCTPSSATPPTGIPLPGGRGYLSALSHHGISSITTEQKTEERALVMRRRTVVDGERRRILDYCQTDVDPLGALLERMLPGIRARPNGFGQALLRGRYMAAVARMERTGVPIDFEMLQRLRTNWGRHQARSDRGDRQGLRRLRGDDVQGRTVRRIPGRQRHRLAAHRRRAACSSTRTRSATWPSGTRNWSR